MVVNVLRTIQLQDIQAPIPPDCFPSELISSPPEKRRITNRHREKITVERPPFINYASPFINPYVELKPVPKNHYHIHRRRSRSKSIKGGKRKQKNEASTNDDVIEEKETRRISSLYKNDLIDLWPTDSPAFNMEFIRQRQIVMEDSTVVEEMKSWEPSSLDELKNLMFELTREKTSIDRVWTIFYWICRNIAYDLDESEKIMSSNEIFRLKKATAQGYATLFKDLCHHLRVPCVIIHGFVKDQYYDIDQLGFCRTNHTWNAVQLDNHSWYLIDSAWASGYMNDQQTYIRDLQTYYFLIRPEYLIYDHLPDDPQWQLLNKPISMLEFVRLPYVHPSYFTCQLTMIYPQFASMVAIDPEKPYTEILIQAPDDVQIVCSVKDSSDGTSLTQYDAQRRLWKCLFAPDQAGFHTLLIFAHRASLSDRFINAIELGMYIRAKDLIGKISLPTVYEKFIEHRCQIHSPLHGILKKRKKVMIHCRIPNAVSARIALDGQWMEEVTLNGSNFKQKIRVPNQEVMIYARFFSSKRISDVYEGLVRYVVHH